MRRHLNDCPDSKSETPTLFSFASWLVYLPLQTTERAMHLVHPKSRHCSFVAQTGDMDDAHFKYYAWELATCVPSTSGQKATAIVMAMPPWTLTPTDLRSFATPTEARTKPCWFKLIPLTLCAVSALQRSGACSPQ